MSIFCSISFAQEINVKKGNITVDGELMLTYTRDDFDVGKIYDLEKNLIVVITFKDAFEDYVETYFVKADIEFSSVKLGTLFFRPIVELLIKDGVITKNGTIDEEKMKIFIRTYD